MVANVSELPNAEAKATLVEYKKNLLQPAADPGGPHGQGTGSTTTCDALLKAGPSQGFENICLLEDLGEFSHHMSISANAEDLKQVIAQAGAAKRLVDSLIASVKVAFNDLQGARANHRRLEKDRAAAAEKRRREMETKDVEQPTKRRAVAEKTGIFSLENGRVDLPVYTECNLKKLFESDGAAAVDLFDAPFIVSQVPWFKALCEADPMQAEIANFRSVFDSSPSKVQTGRGAIKLQCQQLSGQIAAQLVGMFPNGFEVKPTGAAEGSKLLQANLGLAMFGYAANAELAAMERALLPCFRLGFAGTRMVAISRFTDVGEFVRQKTNQANKPYSSNAIKKWFKEAPVPEIMECLNSGVRVWWATVGPHDLIYMPAGCVAMDRVLNSGDYIGVKMAFLSSLDKLAIKDLLAGILDATSMGMSANPVTKEAVKVLEAGANGAKATFVKSCADRAASLLVPGIGPQPASAGPADGETSAASVATPMPNPATNATNAAPAVEPDGPQTTQA